MRQLRRLSEQANAALHAPTISAKIRQAQLEQRQAKVRPVSVQIETVVSRVLTMVHADGWISLRRRRIFILIARISIWHRLSMIPKAARLQVVSVANATFLAGPISTTIISMLSRVNMVHADGPLSLRRRPIFILIRRVSQPGIRSTYPKVRRPQLISGAYGSTLAEPLQLGIVPSTIVVSFLMTMVRSLSTPSRATNTLSIYANV